jgi:major histocompatibility complex class I
MEVEGSGVQRSLLPTKQVQGPGMVAHAFNPNTWEAEAGGFLSSRPAWSTK